jgi:hypothetical protein
MRQRHSWALLHACIWSYDSDTSTVSFLPQNGSVKRHTLIRACAHAMHCFNADSNLWGAAALPPADEELYALGGPLCNQVSISA